MDTPTSPAPFVSTPAPMTTPMSPPPMAPMPKKGMSMWLALGIAAVVVLAYVAFSAYAGMWPFAPAATVSPTPSPTASASASPAASATPDISGWKTYNSQALNMTFRYPADWTVVAGNDYPGSAQGQDYVKISKGTDLIFVGSKTECLTGSTYCKTAGTFPSFSTVSTNPDVKGIIDTIVSTVTNLTAGWNTYDIADTLTVSIPKTWYRTNAEAGAEHLVPEPLGNFGTNIGANDHKAPRTWFDLSFYLTNVNHQAGETWQATANRILGLSSYPAPTTTTLGTYSALKYQKAGSSQSYIVAYPSAGGYVVFWSEGLDQSALNAIRASIKPF